MGPLLIALLVGCRERTELVLGIATDLSYRELSAFRIEVRREGEVLFSEDRRVSGVRGVPWELPGSYGLVSGSGDTGDLEVQVLGYSGAIESVRRRVLTSLASGQTQLLRVGLTSACRQMPCAVQHTCVEGACLEPRRDPESLPPYRAELVASRQCDSGTHFIRTGDNQPMGIAGPGDCPAGHYCDEGLCYPGMRRGPGATMGFRPSGPVAAFQVPASAFASGDWNGDGKPDLVMASDDNPAVYAVLSVGNGSFTTMSSATASAYGMRSLAAGDLDGDGKTDLVGVSATATGVVLLGGGDGTFRPGRTVPLVAPVDKIQVGDVDGDGKLDLVAHGAGSEVIRVHPGTGDGTFGSDRGINLGTPVIDLTLADFDADERSDIAAGGPGGWGVIRSRSDGSFLPFQLMNTGTIWSVAAADFDGDRLPDLGVVTIGEIRIHLGKGDGTFEPPVSRGVPIETNALSAADFDRDGIVDLALTTHVPGPGNLLVLRGMGDGVYDVALRVSASADLNRPILEDFDGDGRPDIAGASSLGTVGVAFGYSR